LQFTRLRLRGFKSFVDPAELVIEPGLTGVVGPNGCGKSNVVEALRWVMGESSARRLRGGEMDDVIFGGSQRRPAHNLAEVAVELDNTDRRAPASFNDSDSLEVLRRIERGKGSSFRVNGREARARDVQVLFADQATGAGATALVSQGRVAALINAKPHERRRFLEEAAGIGGLHARRHEAEQRLNGVQVNLERLDDVLGTLAAQRDSLDAEARQARRYKDLSARIGYQEALLLHLDAEAATAARDRARARLAKAEDAVAEATQASAEAATAQTEAHEALAPLRAAETEAAAALQRLTLAQQALDTEAEQVARSREDLAGRLAQLDADRARSRSQADEAEAAAARLATERDELEVAAGDEGPALTEADRACAAAREAAAAAEADLGRRNEALAADEARAKALARRRREAESRRADVSRQLAEAESTLVRLAEEAEAGAPRQRAAAEDVAAADAALAAARAEAESAEAALSEARARETAAREADQAAEAARARHQAEIDALAEVLARPSAEDHTSAPPVLDALRVTPGFEAALGAALGDDLEAPLNPAAPAHWADLPPLPEGPGLPEGVQALDQAVAAPAALGRRLARIGVVPDRTAGTRLQPLLAAGQCLVSPDGDLWRWDGYVASADAPTPAAQRLAQTNRLSALRAALPPLETEAEAARAAHTAASDEVKAAAATEAAARRAVTAAYERGGHARKAQAEAETAVAETQSRLARFQERRDHLTASLDEAVREVERAAEAEAALPDLESARAAVVEARATLESRRREQGEAQAALDRLNQARARREQRLASLADELATWRRQAESASGQCDELDRRRGDLVAEQTALAARPSEIAARRDALAEEIQAAEQRRQAAADALAAAETRAAAADKGLKAAEARLGEARETRVRHRAEATQADEAVAELTTRAQERFGCTLAGLPETAGLDTADDPPARASVRDTLRRLTREREALGPVNLRAEVEMESLDARIAEMQRERADLDAAVARLQEGIASLNREGRARLRSAFEAVNGHFATLFRRLFGGGRAHLELSGDDDPLAAGLEILASPPGKKLQSLSLLSGGEQALTALALLFAAFLTNPAPICVLDEVDAPLDDANVDRFCALLEELAGAGRARFLVITHHRMTMSRMDRLFGVTMSERGVSRLVSVDLGAAKALRESA